jgi:hypothetical protein
MARLVVSKDAVHEIALEQDLDRLLRAIARGARKRCPPIVSLYDVHGHNLDIGFWPGYGFVHVTPISGLPPYYLTVGDPTAEGNIDFYLHVLHHTPIPRRHLIAASAARAAAIEFWKTGERSADVEWEEI